MKKLILASASPRRREILALSDLKFEIKVSDCDERVGTKEPEQYVTELSKRKAMAVSRSEKNAIVIGADTIVCCDDQILGKPEDETDAFRMLRELSGRVHVVYTGVTVIDTETKMTESFCELTEVEFYELSPEEIRAYINTGEPMDKAGAYGIQGKGARLVKKINGDYYNVVGLPLARLLRVLNHFLYE